MSDNEDNQDIKNESMKDSEQAEEGNEKKSRRRKKPRKKSQGQLLQESLDLDPKDIEDIENKLFMSRFFDYFSEETLDFVFKEKQIDNYKTDITQRMTSYEQGQEEDKLLVSSFNNKQIIEIIVNLKEKAEKLAMSKGINQPFDKRMRKLSLMVTLPMFAIMIVLTFVAGDNLWILFPVLCLFCFLPQLIRGSVSRKWFQFKEENRTQIYTENREDIMILKGFTGEILNNIRTKLIEWEVPLQLISFSLYSRDYENLNEKGKKAGRGITQYMFNFAYPEGMEPFPIPDKLQPYHRPAVPDDKVINPEQNFILLSELKAKDGVITSFVPSLKSEFAEQINRILNESEFSNASKDFKSIIPNYSPDMAIFCLCGKVTKVDNIQICNWKGQFKFYLFEGRDCDCGAQIYGLSLLDDSSEVPEELKDIFTS